MHILEDRENPGTLNSASKERNGHRRVKSNNRLEDLSNLIDPNNSFHPGQDNSKKINKSSSMCLEDISSYNLVNSVVKIREENKKINRKLKKTLDLFSKANTKALTKRDQSSKPPTGKHKRLRSTAITSDINTNNENERLISQIFHMKEQIKDINKNLPEVSLGHREFIDYIKQRIQTETVTPKPGCSCSSCFIF